MLTILSNDDDSFRVIDFFIFFFVFFIWQWLRGVFKGRACEKRIGCRKIWDEILGKSPHPGEDVIRRTGWRV